MKTEKVDMFFRKKAGNECVKVYENGIAEIKFTSPDILKKLNDVNEIKITAEVPVRDTGGSIMDKWSEREEEIKMTMYPLALAAYPFIMLANRFKK